MNSDPNQPQPDVPPVVPDQVAPVPPLKKASRGKAILLAGLALLVIAASAGLFYVVRTNQIASSNATATATARVNANNATATVQTDLTNTVVSENNANATATPQAATATAQANATATVQTPFTANEPNPYPPYTGKIFLRDPLQNDSQHYWIETADGTCAFISGAYHIKGNTGCLGNLRTNLGNLVFQVEMTIIKQYTSSYRAGGGIAIRSNTPKFEEDVLLFLDGSYVIDDYYMDPIPGSVGKSSAFKTGLNQSNIIALVANGKKIDLYVNKQFVTRVIVDITHAQSGCLTLYGQGGEVMFRNAMVWTF